MRRLSNRRAKTYAERNQFLRQLGFDSYRDYLMSELWRAIRSKRLRRDTHCFRCGAGSSQVHHRYYSKRNLAGQGIGGLHAVCENCHALIELGIGGRKLTLAEAMAQTDKIMGWGQKNGDRKHRFRRRVMVGLEATEAATGEPCQNDGCQNGALAGGVYCARHQALLNQLVGQQRKDVAEDWRRRSR